MPPRDRKRSAYPNDGINMVITDKLKEQYPFDSHFLELAQHKLHYINEGEGKEVLVLVHGNPTWSFFYRNIIKELRTKYRVVAIDHMGCGLSDKPKDYPYTLERRIQDLSSLLDHLKIKNFNMMVHDWGGAIGIGLATRYPERLQKLILLNTAAFKSEHIPFTIGLCKLPFFGPFIVKYLNAFCYPATFMTTVKKLPKIIKKGYLLPYEGAAKRVAISEFVQDIPLHKNHVSYKTLDEIERNLPLLKGEKLILWGGKDFCFNDHFYNKWKGIYPEAKSIYYENAGHYIIEDELESVLLEMNKFLGASDEA